jgi:hypothetical protein
MTIVEDTAFSLVRSYTVFPVQFRPMDKPARRNDPIKAERNSNHERLAQKGGRKATADLLFRNKAF